MDLKQQLEGQGINNIEASKNFIKTEFATVEVREDKDNVLTLLIQLKELSNEQVNEILKSLNIYLK
jgi:hypothetical protein